jgi:hypothetical protein
MSDGHLLRDELQALRRQLPGAEEDLERARTRLQYIQNRIGHYTILLENQIKRDAAGGRSPAGGDEP